MITALIGHRGVGKSTLLKRLEVIFSQHEDIVFKDLDNEIETVHRRSIPSIFQQGGEAEFRQLERSAFEKLHRDLAGRARVFIAIGAGFEFPIPKDVHTIWLRRPSDVMGRIFLNRPKLSDLIPLDEWRRRFQARETRYRQFADEELTLPEGGLHDKILEEHFFTGGPRMLPYVLSALPENFRPRDFFDRRRQWGVKWIELRDDLLTGTQMQNILSTWPPEKILYSVRKTALAAAPEGIRHVDWALELGAPTFPVEVLSLHTRKATLAQTLKEFSAPGGPILKLAVEINDFSELLEGHRWWRKDPNGRAFLPRSKNGRWQWYRQLFGPQMPMHFFREGDGTCLDQPYLWQTLTSLRWTGGFAAILGSPVTQSWTPSFQREFMDQFKIPVVAVDVGSAEWDQALPILRELGLQFAAVTSPLKKLAFLAATEHTPDAKAFETVNTLARTDKGWAADNTDLMGAQTLFRGEFRKPIPIVVWGGGGTKAILKEVLPNAEFVSARAGKRLTEPVAVVWAVGRDREFVWPEPALYIQEVIDLNYGENSPGREIAQRAGSPYKSGESMFIHQGLQQREFWKRYL